MNNALEICGIKLGPWKEKKFSNGVHWFERFVGDEALEMNCRVRVWAEDGGFWKMYGWDELGPLQKWMKDWHHQTIGEVLVDHVLNAADEFLIRCDRLRSFQ